jgi:hypothetical protein
MYAFMERMVVDKSVTHVLIFCDSEYASRADARRAGVGTESQFLVDRSFLLGTHKHGDAGYN